MERREITTQRPASCAIISKCRDEMWRCWTVAHKCHGKNKIPHDKTENLTAKLKTSRQKQNTSQQNQNPHCKTKDLTVKPNTSQQNSWLVKSFCREVFGFAVTVVGNHTASHRLQSFSPSILAHPVPEWRPLWRHRTTNCKSVLPTRTGEKLLKVVSSKALSGVRPNYALFLTTTQF